MPKMSKEERAELEARLAADDEEDDDDGYEIEIYSPEGHGARLPYRKGKSYLAQHFGIDADTLPKPNGGKAPRKTPGKSTDNEGNPDGSGDGTDNDPQNLNFFQRRQQQRESAS